MMIQNKIKKILFKVTQIGISLFILALAINHLTHQLIFHPTHDELPLSLPFENLFLKVERNEQIHAFYLPTKEQKPTLLFFHGRSYNITHFQDFAQMYQQFGYGVLLFDYRGFGKSKGKNTEKNMYADGQAALHFLLQQLQIPARQIIIWGHSLGNAIAIETVKNNPLPYGAIILQSPFTNTAEMGIFLLTGSFHPQNPWTLWGAKLLTPLVWNKQFDNLAKISSLSGPILIGYSKEDETIPWQMSARLAAFAPAHTVTYASDTGTHQQFEWFKKAALSFLSVNSHVQADKNL